MSHNRTITLFGLVLAALLVVVAGTESLSYAVGDRLCGCGDSTPCPCAADGICRPKRVTWGHYDTRWRTWPGEADERAASAAGATPDVADPLQELKGYELPKPEQEDLRVPPKAKKKKDDQSEAEVPSELPGEDPNQFLPGPADAPGAEEPLDLDPFGVIPQVPNMEDAPPELPSSLRQAAVSLSRPRVAKRAAAVQLKATPPVGLNITPAMLSQPVRQVSWEQQSGMPTIGQATAIQNSAVSEPLQQAIYIEEN